MSSEANLKDIKHGIAAVIRSDENPEDFQVVHFVGFFEKPNEDDWNHIKDELETDEDLGLVGMDFDLIEATPDMIDFFTNMEEGKGESNIP